MSLELGGRADKSGNTYENRFFAELLLELLQERLCSIEVERLGGEGVGVEFIANDLDGGRRYYQCKASNGTNQHWRPSDLNGYDVFQNAKSHITSGEKHTYHFISPLAYDSLDSLCSRARSSYDTADFLENQLTNQPLCSWWKKSKKYFKCTDDGEAIDLLSQCYFEQIPDGAEHIRRLESLIALLFVQESSGTATAIRIQLENYANDGRRWGKPIIAQDVATWLSQAGYHQRMLSHDERGLPHIQEINRLYQESFHPIGPSLFHRKESESILEYIRKENFILVLGKAGAGKSGCIHEVVKKLESESVPYLALSLDKYRPEELPDKYGQSLGLLDSPVSSLYRLAGGRSCALIFDQLDALRWTNTGTSKALDICKEMIRQAEQLNRLESGKISVVFVARTFDYETDPGLRNLFDTGDKATLHWETVRIGLLSQEEVKDLVGGIYESMSPRLRTLLQTPSNLYVWERIAPASRNSIKSLRQLMEQWWEQTKGSCMERGLTAIQIDRCRDRLVSIMQSREELSLPLLLFQNEYHEIEALSSQGLLVKAGEKISFAHQSFFDFFSVKKLMDELYENGKHLPELFPDRDKQTPDTRYQLLMLLQYLCDADMKAFITECRALLKSSNIRYYFQCCVFEIIGQIEKPDQAVQKLLFEYFNDDKWHGYVFQAVFWGHPSFLSVLDNLYPDYAWNEAEGCSLLRSVISRDPELVLSILQRQGGNHFSDESLYDILSSISPDKSEAAFLMRLELLKKDTGLLREEFELYRMIEQGSPLAVPIIQIIIDAGPERRNNLYFPEEKQLKVFSEKNTKEIVDSLLAPAMRAAAKEEAPYGYFNNQWSAKYRTVSVERRIVQMIQPALSHIAQNEPERFFRYVEEYQEESPIKAELILHAVENVPIAYADWAVTWLLGDFDRRAFDKTGREKTALSCCRRIIERFSPHCLPENFAQLEAFICQWSLPVETMRSIFKEQVQVQHMEGGGNCYASFWGDLQSVLLPALDARRTSERTKQLIGVLQRKFPQGTHVFDLSRIGTAQIIRSPIESHRAKLSDKSWLKLVENMSKTPQKASTRHWNDGVESSPQMFSQSLGRAAKENPIRFAKLLLQFPSDTQEMFVTAIIDALSSSDVPLDLVCVILRQFCQNPSREMAISFARIVEARAEEEWPQDILQQLITIARQHEDPQPNDLSASSSEISKSTSCDDLWQGSINCARGYGFHAIGALLMANPDSNELFRDVVQSAVEDSNVSVLFGVAYCAALWYNIDKEFSEQLFIQLAGRDLRILAAPFVWQIPLLCYSKKPDYYRDALMKAARSSVSDLSTCALEVMAVLADEDDWMVDKLLSMTFDKVQADAVCKQAAECFEFERSYASSKIILNHMIDNYPDSISQMSILFYRKTIQLQRDQDFLQKLLLCKDRHVSHQVLDFLCEADGNVLDYVQAISGFIKESAMSEYYYELKDLAAFVARLFHQGKDDLPTRRTCLDLWDDIFWYKPMAIKPLSDLMDQVEM